MTTQSEDLPEVKAFGIEIRRRREETGLTVEKLASLSHLSPGVVSAIESGEHEPSLAEVFALTHGLRIEPGALFDAPSEYSAMAEEVGRQVEKLTPEAQEAFLAFLHTIVKQDPT